MRVTWKGHFINFNPLHDLDLATILRSRVCYAGHAIEKKKKMSFTNK